MTQSLPDAIVDEAIRWLIRLEMSDSNADICERFEQWHRQNPQHQLAWQRVKEMHAGFSSLPVKPIADTLDTLEERRAVSRRQLLKTLCVTGLLFGGGWFTQRHTPWQRLLADMSTVTGEQKNVTLADGTHVMLNTDSAITADLKSDLRRLVLHRGEIAVTTGTDSDYNPKRPFVVDTSFGRIQAIGTRFIVRLGYDRARIHVQEGNVRLFDAGGNSQLMASGESFWLSGNGISTAAASIIPPDAWMQGVISGKNIPLGELLDELARYRTGVIDYSAEMADLLVSGVFHLKDTDQTLRFISQVHPVRVDFRTSYWVVVRPA